MARVGEEQPPELIGLDATRSWRCRRASYPRSRPDFSPRLKPALKPLFLRAVRTVITRLMEAAGLPEPYRRLTERPDYVPQWCSKHWLKAGERKGGGKRRRAS